MTANIVLTVREFVEQQPETKKKERRNNQDGINPSVLGHKKKLKTPA